MRTAGHQNSRLVGRSLRAALRRNQARILTFIVIALLLFAGFEIAIRTRSPDAVEILAYNNRGELVYDQTTYDLLVVQKEYAAVTAYPEPFTNPLAPCARFPFPPYKDSYTFRFLWHTLPIAVAASSPRPVPTDALFACGNAGSWYLSSGGIPNPRPYVGGGIMWPEQLILP